MKQYIIKEQWDELSDGGKINFTEKTNFVFCVRGIPASVKTHLNFIESELVKPKDYPNIGQMIEFLGNDDIDGDENGYFRVSASKVEQICDVLWEAVKDKLTTEQKTDKI